jgi:phosphopantothenoylcysteine decarboxylase/phosphopantothenate--cysteine ligase
MGNHVVIGISGGIAAYKTMYLIRLFKKNGWEVRVTATQNALQFVTPLTIETLSQSKLYTDMFDVNRAMEVEHIALAEWADALVVAPATANIIGKFAHGIADDALSTLFLAVKKPVFIAPAMNSNMFENTVVQQNIGLLRERGYHILLPNEGFLACGTTGSGRMQEPEEISKMVA